MRRHDADWSALVAGLVFTAIGVTALVASRGRFADALVWVWPSALLGLGAALLLRSAGQDRSSDEVSTERGEDR
jgi:hypothetical protein